MLLRMICLAVGYVCGLFQTSYIYGKKQGIDIREHGDWKCRKYQCFAYYGGKRRCA